MRRRFVPLIRRVRTLFSDRYQVETLLESIERLFNYIVALDSADFTTAISSDLKRVNNFLHLKLNNNRRRRGSISHAEADSSDATNEIVVSEHVRELSWEESTLAVPTANVRNATISKDERLLAVEYNRQIVIYALSSGDTIPAIRLPDELHPASRKWYGRYSQFAFSPTGRTLLSVG